MCSLVKCGIDALMHFHLSGIALGLLASAWLPNWLPIPALMIALAGLTALAFCAALWCTHRCRQGYPPAAASLGLNTCLLAVAFGAGGLYGLHRIDAHLERRLPADLHGQMVTGIVELVSLPDVAGSAMRPIIRVEAQLHDLIAGWGLDRAPPQRLRLTWFDAPAEVRTGDLWRMQLKLRAPVGTLNATGFDYEAWLLAAHIDALASVQSGTLLRSSEGASIHAYRAWLREFFMRLNTASKGSLLALASADASLMKSSDWHVFRKTGTIHLMIISGLHLGLLALFGGLLGLGLARLSRNLCDLIPAQYVAALCGVTVATGFATLCGWTLPVQRAFIMVSCFALALVTRRHLRGFDAWLIAMAIVLASNPWASLSAGFWLSFGAVALLMMIGWRGESRSSSTAPQVASRIPGSRMAASWIQTLIQTQLLLSLAMAPLLLMVIGELPLISPLANLVAVPVTTLVIVPLVLCASLVAGTSTGLAATILEFAGRCFDWQFRLLELLAAVPPLYAVTFNTLLALVCLLSILSTFYPCVWPLRALLLAPGALLVIVLAPSAELLPHGDFRVTVFDVGQGLSVLIETRHKRLLYDAGARYGDDFDFGEAVVLPGIRSLGHGDLDRLLLSHWDNDHAGGARSIAQELRIGSLMASADGALRFPLGDALLRHVSFEACEADDSWHWDGVRFTLLHPGSVGVARASSNDRSCVLHIDNGRFAALLPGDISQAVEFEIMHRVQPVHLLLAPHHGSRSSSSISFLRRTAPRMVFVSSGFANRFGHPHEDRVAAWHSVGARVLETAKDGGLRWSSTEPDIVRSAREQRSAYWRTGNSE